MRFAPVQAIYLVSCRGVGMSAIGIPSGDGSVRPPNACEALGSRSTAKKTHSSQSVLSKLDLFAAPLGDHASDGVLNDLSASFNFQLYFLGQTARLTERSGDRADRCPARLLGRRSLAPLEYGIYPGTNLMGRSNMPLLMASVSVRRPKARRRRGTARSRSAIFSPTGAPWKPSTILSSRASPPSLTVLTRVPASGGGT